MKTAMQKLIYKMKNEAFDINHAVDMAELLLKQEKKQIINAYNIGWNNRWNDGGDYSEHKDADDYYNQTFNTKEGKSGQK